MPNGHSSSVFEPLNDREREILALLSENLSDREIAARLHLSPTTVKWYNKGIYQKLGVESRKQAADRARVLGILASTEQPLAAPHNLPSQLTPFVGRIGELEEIGRWITDPSSRLLTLTAPGGMGKSRLALAAAQAALYVFHDGVFFVPLAPVGRPDDVVEAIIMSAGVPRMQDGRSPVQQACDFFAHKHILLVLDNFEHLLDAADLVTTLLQAAPHLKVVVTSRERLNLSAETVYTLSGLHFPAEAASHDLSEYGAVQMFMHSALRADPHFAGHGEDIARVCRLVQGMPLAIELAAAWVSAMTPAEIATEIERSADFLSTQQRDVPERQRSVRAVFDLTWARLSEPERTTFAAMSAFRGGCTQEAALQVTGTTRPVIAALIGKALIWRDAQTGRLSVHELLRQYAAEELDRAGGTARIRDAHRIYYAAYTDKWALALRDDQLNALDHLDRDYDNIVQAFEAATEFATPEAILPYTRLWNYYTIRGLLRDGARLFDASIEALEGTESVALARSLGGRAEIAMYQWDRETQTSCALRGIELTRRIDAELDLPLALVLYGNTLVEPERALDVYHESLTIAERLGDSWAIGVSTHLIGFRLRYLGQIAEARPWTERSHSCGLQLNSPWALAHTYYGLYDQARAEGDWLTARRMLEESLQAAQQIGLALRILFAYLGLANVMLKLGRPLDAKPYAIEMLRIARHSGYAVEIAGALTYLADVCGETGDLGEAVQYMREAKRLRSESAADALDRLQVGGSLLLRAGLFEQAATILSSVINHPEFAGFGPMERERRIADLGTCRELLGNAAFDAIAEAASRKSLDELHAELYAILDSPSFHPLSTLPD